MTKSKRKGSLRYQSLLGLASRQKMKVFLDSKKGYYKANLHCHTTNSDGKLTPEQIKDIYKSRGYSAVAFTDHEHLIDNSHLTDDGFVAITGCELAIKEESSGSTLRSPRMKATHLCLWAKDPHNDITPCYSSVADHFITPSVEGRVKADTDEQRVYTRECVERIISTARERGFLVCYNHPSWSLQDATDYPMHGAADFIEVFNTGSVMGGLYCDEAAYSEMLRLGYKVMPVAADDNHNRRPVDSADSDSFGGFVMINADRLDYSSLISSLERGDFYASTSPSIYSLTLDGRTVRVKTSPVKKISVISGGRPSKARIADGEEYLTEWELTLPDSFDGFRIKLDDGRGGMAFTRFYEI